MTNECKSIKKSRPCHKPYLYQMQKYDLPLPAEFPGAEGGEHWPRSMGSGASLSRRRAGCGTGTGSDSAQSRGVDRTSPPGPNSGGYTPMSTSISTWASRMRQPLYCSNFGILTLEV